MSGAPAHEVVGLAAHGVDVATRHPYVAYGCYDCCYWLPCCVVPWARNHMYIELDYATCWMKHHKANPGVGDSISYRHKWVRVTCSLALLHRSRVTIMTCTKG
jgi:hypothetical protein